MPHLDPLRSVELTDNANHLLLPLLRETKKFASSSREQLKRMIQMVRSRSNSGGFIRKVSKSRLRELENAILSRWIYVVWVLRNVSLSEILEDQSNRHELLESGSGRDSIYPAFTLQNQTSPPLQYKRFG
jgi:hypothetical protein